MDISFNTEDLAFGDEVRAFIEAEFTPDLREKSLKSLTGLIDREGHIKWQKALHRKGWAAPRWAKEYGGAELSPSQLYVFEAEMAKAGAPRTIGFGTRLLGPVLQAFGNDEQKAHYLPRILSFDDWWCQGYSEPGSGSDLASLQTKAVRDGDDYIVNGAKVWTTKAQDADWIFCLVRTSNEGRKQEGITFLMIDMRTPGVSVNPITLMDLADDGLQEVNEVIFQDVRVPVANRVGEENKGWTYAKYLLEFERGGSYAASLLASLNRLRTFARQEVAGGERLIDDASFTRKMATLETEITALELAELRTLSAMSAGERPGAQSSIIKLRGSDLIQTMTELNLQAVGYYGLPYDREWFPYGGNMESIGPGHSPTALFRYCNRRKVTIYGGTNEVQRTIIAKHILGL